MIKLKKIKTLSLTKWFYMNYLIRGNHGVKYQPLKGTYLDISKSFSSTGRGTIILNADRYVSSKMYTYFAAAQNSELCITGRCHVSYGCDIKIFSDGKLELHNCSLNSYSQIRCKNHIYIGENTRISRNVQIWDDDHHKIKGASDNNKEIIIEKNVWIGAGAIILKGVRIGEGSMVAAGAVVTRSIPSHCVVGGVPARIISKDFYWEY